jgi:hypothetical protein
VRITVDSGPGLRVTEFRARGKDVIRQLASTLGASSGRPLGIRLYPTGLEPDAAASSSSVSADGSNSTVSSSTKRLSFRAIARIEPAIAANRNGTRQDSAADSQAGAATEEKEEGVDACQGVWGEIGAGSYANRGLTEFIFHLAGDGRARRIEAPAWQLVLDKAALAADS